MQRNRDSASSPARQQRYDKVVAWVAQQRNATVTNVGTNVAQHCIETSGAVDELCERPTSIGVHHREALLVRLKALP